MLPTTLPAMTPAFGDELELLEAVVEVEGELEVVEIELVEVV